MKNKMLYDISEWLLIVGGISLGLEVLNFNLMSFIPEEFRPVLMGVIGLGAVYIAYLKLTGEDR